ncbi:hypothetical protein I552_4722 [Mycobacterium xenopi 3993]|nr:hypothetical protein I552_4722 [Mycobacterium xenopi 3993]
MHGDAQRRHEGGCGGRQSGAPETKLDSAPWLPIERAEVLDGDADWVPQTWRNLDTTLVAAPLLDTHTAVMLGRPADRHSAPRKWRGWAI